MNLEFMFVYFVILMLIRPHKHKWYSYNKYVKDIKIACDIAEIRARFGGQEKPDITVYQHMYPGFWTRLKIDEIIYIMASATLSIILGMGLQ